MLTSRASARCAPAKAARRCRAFAGRVMAQLSQDELKKQAAWKAVDYVKSGMVVGLGTGSTAAFAVDRIGQLLKEGKLTNIVGVPTSIRTYEQAKSLGIPLATLDEQPKLDVAIDGADEVRSDRLCSAVREPLHGPVAQQLPAQQPAQ
jgi:ribose 5-phosphate isomerase A